MAVPVRVIICAAASLFLASPAPAQSIKYVIGRDVSRESPEVNIYLSKLYDHLLQTNRHFRAYRIVKECRPISLEPLQADCVASFDQYEPFIAN